MGQQHSTGLPASCCRHRQIATKNIVDNLDNPISISGVAWDPNRIKVWAAHANAVWLIDVGDPTVDGDVVATFQFNPGVGGDSIVDGLAYDGGDDSLYYSPDQNCCVYQFSLGTDFIPANPALGTLINTVAPENSVGTADGNISGVVVGSGNSLYVGRPAGNEIRRVDKTTGEFITQFAALSPSAWVEDLTCDPVTYAPKEAILAKYAFNSLYEAFEVETGTCPLALAQADVSLAKTDGPDPVAIGSQLTYTLTVTNETTENFATGLVVTDTLPGDVAFKSATPSQGTVDPVTGAEVIWNVGELSGGQSETLKILVIVDPSTLDGTILTNTATVEGAQLDPDTSNNTTEEDTTALVPVCTLVTTPSHAADTLTVDVLVGTNVAATGNLGRTAQSDMVSLFSGPLAITEPAINASISKPLPPSGTVGILTTLSLPELGLICSDYKTLDTGSAP